MKESKINEQFEEISAKMRDESRNRLLLRHLSGIRDAVRGLQDAGMDATLVVRPGDYECPLEKDGSSAVLANGTIMLDGLKVDFMLQSYESDRNRFRAMAGRYHVAYEYFSETNDVKASFTEALLRTKAKFRMVEEFNLDANGNIATSKDLSVSPPLKLKKPPDFSL